MVGALRLVSVEQGHDPRDYALIAFGGAGPLHANALVAPARLLAVDHPAGAGRAVRARRRDDGAARRVRAHLHPQVRRDRREGDCAASSSSSRRPRRRRSSARRCRRRRCGAASRWTCATTARACGSPIDVDPKDLQEARPQGDLGAVRRRAQAAVHLRAAARARVRGAARRRAGPRHPVKRPAIARGSRDPKAAAVGKQPVYVDRRKLQATVYDRAQAQGRQPHQGTRDRDGNGLDHGDAAEAHRRSSTASATS